MIENLKENKQKAIVTSVFGDWRLPEEAFMTQGGDGDNKMHSEFPLGDARCYVPKLCEPGLILPLWLPHTTSDDLGTMIYRALIYGAALAYLLFGVSIVTDRIVSCCEVMASHKRTVTVKLKSGGTTTILERVWHPAVSYITFGVIGTSSPEILIPVIEIFNRGFQGDELGPSLIVGSGAYHLFLITSICLLSVRDSNAKPIKDLYLFFTTASFAILSYLWVYLILAQFSPGIIEVWEAVVTFLLFPVLIIIVWVIARRFPQKLFRKLSRCIRMRILKNAKKRRKRPPSRTGEQTISRTPSEIEGSEAGGGQTPISHSIDAEDTAPEEEEDSPEDERRRRLVALMQRLKKQYPERSQQEIEEIAQVQLLEDTGRSAAFYRLQATKAISGARNVMAIGKMREKLEEQGRRYSGSSTVQIVGFASATSTCHESCGTTQIRVKRWGAGLSDTTLTLFYETVEGTAKADVNFVPTSGCITFEPGEDKIDITVQILDDDIYEETAKFFVIKLSNPVFESCSTISKLPSALIGPAPGKGIPSGPTVPSDVSRVDFAIAQTKMSILDDDHCGVFGFERQEQAIPDNIDVARIRVIRSIGSKGRIAVSYRITPGTAKPQQDYVAAPKGTLHFEDGQTEGLIDVKIIDKNRFGEVYTFYMELLSTKKESTDVKPTIGDPKLGEPKIIQIGICEDEELENMLDRLLKMTDLAEYFMASSWRDQLVDAFTVPHDEDIKSKSFHIKLYTIHVLSFPWKLIVAILPPARIWHGWVAYISLLCLMGFVAALIGDCATHLGCTIGLKNTVTAITLIPFGMGLPDTFASRRAAIHEPTADAAIGQITGSNAVTVFLGMGLAWTIGALFQNSHGGSFRMPPTDFGFSVMLYCTFASACVIVLLLRRLPPIRGELGGPFSLQILSALFFISLWILFVVLSVLKNYCFIAGFTS